MDDQGERWTSVLRASIDGADSRRLTIDVLEWGPRLGILASVESGRPVGDFWHHAATFEIQLSLGSPVMCLVNAEPRMWSVTNGIVEPLEELMWWAMSELWGPEAIETDASGYLVRGAEDPARDRASRQIHDVREVIAGRARQHVKPREGALVAAMESRTAFCAYTALVDDSTGRIAQMIKTCPNVFTLVSASSLASQSWMKALGRIARAICDGVRLPKIVDEALAIGLPAYIPQGCASTLNRHANALVRDLPPLAANDLLSVLYAPGADINDLHAANECGAQWAGFVAAWSRRARSIDDVPRALRLGGFLSRHAALLWEQLHSPDELLDWIERTAAPVPGRSTSPARVCEEVTAWHRSLWDREFLDETPLKPGPRTTKVIAGIEVEQLLTVGSLVAEGARMHHCVASLAGDAVDGECFIYRAEVLGASVTIDLRRLGDGWAIHEAAGFENRRPTLDELCVIGSWVQALR